MSSHMKEILQQIGWDNGFHVPIANADNQNLEAELEMLTIKKAKTKSIYKDALSRFEALAEHLKYVEQEAEQNQKLITAHNQQIDAERHKLKISQSEKDRVNQEIRHMNKNIEGIEQRQHVKKADLTKNMVKLEKLKSETTWDVEALEAWEASLKKRDEDNELLKKFSKEDEHKANELEARRQNLQLEVINRKSLVDKMMAEITNYEQVVERTGRIFKQQTDERMGLVARWQDAVKNLHQRDEDIDRASREIYMTQEVIAQQQEALDEQNNFLKNEKNNNKLVEEEIAELNIINSNKRKEFSEMMQYSLELTNQVNGFKRVMCSSGHHLEKERIRCRNIQKEFTDLRIKITKSNADIEQLRQKLKEVNESSFNSVERTKRLEQLIDYEYKLTDNLVADTEKTQGVLYRSRIELKQEKDISKIKRIQITGCEISIKLLTKRTKQTLNRLILQKEVVYALDYRISEMEVKIAELEGQRKDEEVIDAVNTKVTELERILSEHTEVRNFLQAQVTRLEEEMRRLGIAIASESSRLELLRGKLQDQVLLFEGGVKQAAAAKLRSQQLQVEENVLRLKVSQLNKSTSKEEKSIYDLQKFRIELETALRERQIEINTHKDILFAQKKNLDEARGRLNADIKRRKIRIEQFQKKYSIALMTLGKDEDGQPLSITHFKIRNAQEKYMLQEQGDELDNRIKTAEKEIIAMENTLKVVNMTNTTYKESLTSVKSEGEEYVELKQLEQEIVNTNIVLRQCRKAMMKKKRTIKDLVQLMEKLNQKRIDLSETLIKCQDEYCSLKREEELTTEKLNRINKQIKSLKRNVADRDMDKPQRNLEIRNLQEGNKSALKKLGDLCLQYEEISPTIKQFLLEYNLQLPGFRSSLSLSSSSLSSLTSCSVNSSTSSCLSQVVLSFDPGNSVKKIGKEH